MKKQKSIPILLGIAGIAIFFSLLIRTSTGKKEKPELTSGTVYYTGPMRPLGGKNYLATEDGKMSPIPTPPPSKASPKKPSESTTLGK